LTYGNVLLCNSAFVIFPVCSRLVWSNIRFTNDSKRQYFSATDSQFLCDSQWFRFQVWQNVNIESVCSLRSMFMFMTQICDFGLAKWKEHSKTISTFRKQGTVTHIPPESWSDNSRPRTVKYDVYSFAVLLWELFTEKKPFENGIVSN